MGLQSFEIRLKIQYEMVTIQVRKTKDIYFSRRLFLDCTLPTLTHLISSTMFHTHLNDFDPLRLVGGSNVEDSFQSPEGEDEDEEEGC